MTMYYEADRTRKETKMRTCHKAIAVTRKPKHHFFGYYDKSPWDITERYIWVKLNI